eukprot:PITA_16266
MDFPKALILTPYNYHEWKDQIARYLHHKGLYRIIMATEVEPTLTIEKLKYLNRMDEAHGSICSCISPELQFHLSACNTPNEIWEIVEELYEKQDKKKGHLLEVALLSLDPQNYDRIQDFFTKYNDLLLQLKDCGIDKSKEESRQVLSIMSKLGPEYSVFVSTFHSQKEKGKAVSYPKKEGYTKPFNDSSGSRNEKGKKGNRYSYCQRGFHPKSSCMKKQINQMAEILQKHNLGDHIPQGTKKKTEDPPHRKGNNFHALVAINSSLDAWIIDSGGSHHMATAKEVYSSLDA